MSEEKTDFHLVDEQPSSKKDWEISDLYSKAWNIVKNHKVTWIFGAAVAATAAGSTNFRSNSSTNSDDLQHLFNIMPKEATSSAEMTKVLGESINPFQQLFTEIIQQIPTYYYGLLIAEILFLIIVGILITLIYRAWAHASLIESVYSAFKHNKTAIAEASEAGFKHIKPFIWLDIIPGLIIFIVAFIYGLLFALGVILGNTTIKILVLILGIIGIFPLIYYALLISIAVIWAYRETALSDLSTKTAFWKGYQIAKKKKVASLILGFINNISTLIITMAALIIPIGFGIVAFITYLNTKQIPYVLIGLSAISGLIIFPLLIVFGAIAQAFKASVWTIAYDKIKGKYTNES